MWMCKCAPSCTNVVWAMFYLAHKLSVREFMFDARHTGRARNTQWKWFLCVFPAKNGGFFVCIFFYVRFFSTFVAATVTWQCLNVCVLGTNKRKERRCRLSRVSPFSLGAIRKKKRKSTIFCRMHVSCVKHTYFFVCLFLPNFLKMEAQAMEADA